MHTLKIVTTRSLFGFILFLILLLFGCATGPGYKYEYEELEINYNSIYEVVKPGTSISIKTKDASGIYILIGYEDDDTLVCVDESGEVSSKIKIAIDDLESIHIREQVWDTYADIPPPKTNTQIFFEELTWGVLGTVFFFGVIAILIGFPL